MPPVRFLGDRCRWAAAFAAMLTANVVVIVLAVAAQESASPPNSPDRNATPPATGPSADAAAQSTDGEGRIEGYLAGGRWREGSKLLEVQGQFKTQSGDRVTFLSTDGKSRFACLENLNSERVARIIEESPETLEWTVHGTLTEFRGENYLLVTQAVIRSRGGRGSRPATDRAAPL